MQVCEREREGRASLGVPKDKLWKSVSPSTMWDSGIEIGFLGLVIAHW